MDLEQGPNLSGAKSLTGLLAGHYRLRTGEDRLQFRIQRALEAKTHRSPMGIAYWTVRAQVANLSKGNRF